jgi:hypothetical protein
MHGLNGVCLWWLNGANWFKLACNPRLVTLGQIARTLFCFVLWLDLTGLTGQGHRSDRCCPVGCTGWTLPTWLVGGTGLIVAAESVHLFFALCISWHTHHEFIFVAHTCCTPLILRYRGSSHTLSSKFVLLAFEAKFLKFNSKHKLRGSSSYI